MGDVALAPAVTARLGRHDARDARARAHADPFPYLLLLDDADRPLGWVDQDDIPASGTLTAELASAMSPLFDRRTTLKDALSMLLDEDVQAGVVVDRRGAVRGLVTARQVMAFMRDTAREAGRLGGRSPPRCARRARRAIAAARGGIDAVMPGGGDGAGRRRTAAAS